MTNRSCPLPETRIRKAKPANGIADMPSIIVVTASLGADGTAETPTPATYPAKQTTNYSHGVLSHESRHGRVDPQRHATARQFQEGSRCSSLSLPSPISMVGRSLLSHKQGRVCEVKCVTFYVARGRIRDRQRDLMREVQPHTAAVREDVASLAPHPVTFRKSDPERPAAVRRFRYQEHHRFGPGQSTGRA